MNDSNCYTDGDMNGIVTTACDFCGKIVWCDFLQVFRPLPSYGVNATTILPYFWKMYKSGEEIDEEAIAKALALSIERKRLDEEILKNPQGFQEVLRIVQDFLCSAEKEYYSGISGLFRAFKDSKMIKAQSEYKKLV